MNANDITCRTHNAIARYLQIRGHEILADKWAHGQDSVDFVIRDGDNGDLAFVVTQVSSDTGQGIPEAAHDRKAFERIAAAYLAGSDVTDCTVRLDSVSLLVIGDDRAIIRHHVNVLGSVG